MTETSLRHHRDKTETRPRQDRDKEASSVDTRGTAFCHSYTGLPKGAQYTNSNWNFRFCTESRSKCLSMFISLSFYPQKIKTPSPEQEKTARQHQRHNTKPSPTHHQNITAPSPHIKESSPKHARDVTNTSLKDPKNTTKKPTKQHQKNTETSPKKDRDKTETSQRHHQNHTETSPRHHRDITKTTPRHDRDMTETSPRQGIIRRHTGHSILPQLHWFAQRSTIYKFKLEF